MRAAQTSLLAVVLLGALFASVAARPGEQPALPRSVLGRTVPAGSVRPSSGFPNAEVRNVN